MDWTVHIDDAPYAFIPVSSAARQWAIDCMPASVQSDGGIYFLEGEHGHQMLLQLELEGFSFEAIRDSYDPAPRRLH